MSLTIWLTIRNDTRYLAFLRGWVEAIAAVVGKRRFPLSARRAVSLSLIEAVDNAIFHACPPRSRGRLPIGVAVEVAAHEIRVAVVDCGRGFVWPARVSPSPLATHGRGLLLMQSLMTRVEQRRTKGHHQLRMIYQL